MKSKNAKRHTYTEVMGQLKAAGSAQTRKTYARHGMDVEMFGVSYATLKAMDKKIAYDTDLAKKLWASGNHDARVFACWIVEEQTITAKLLDSWAKDVDYRGLGYEFATLAAYSKHAARQSKKWRKMKSDVRCGMGWIIVANVATQPDRPVEEGGMTDDELGDCLEEIEAKIHTAANGTRSNMNGALIAIGCRPSMSRQALAVARRVGVVEVDQGDTSCKTRVAYDSIKKTLAHYKAKGQTPVDGAAGQRRRHC